VVEVARAVAVAIAFAHLFFEWCLGAPQSAVWGWSTIAAISLRLFLDRESSPLIFTSGIALFYLFIVPCAGFLWRGQFEALWFLCFTFLILETIRSLPSRDTDVLFRRDYSGWSVVAVLVCLSISIIGPAALDETFFSRIAFMAPFSVSLIFFEQVLRSRARFVSLSLLCSYVLVIAIYVAYFWSGFGRLVIASFVLMPVLLATRYLSLPLRLWHAILISPVAMALSHISRYGDFGDPAEWTKGSAGHHIELSMALSATDVSDFLGGFERWIGQMSLLLLNWVPREFWPSKPIGLGSSSVDDWIGRMRYGEGYSVSLGFVGEQLYLLGDFFLIGVIASFGLLLICRVLIINMSGSFVAPLVAFDINLISYLWGGNATYGSRVWFFVAPMLLFVFAMRFFSRKQIPSRFEGGSA
jgi:hypothetical protein